ncbi:Gp5/Type VI secretion system Vgr protein OB-fold domain-containing protein [Tumidithrix helvetica PCC 7403]|uniref:VgrG-related protein n=1 Tax=Tumidithrix helvetica TaxID=3457545 RepID=UPI003CAC2047
MPTPTYFAGVKIRIDGSNAPAELFQDLLQISIEESLHLPSMFTLVINNDYFAGDVNDVAWKHDDLFAIGKKIEIDYLILGTSRSVTPDTIFEGEITAIEAQFTSDAQAPIIVRGYDVSHRLHRGRYNRSFVNMKDSEIVTKIIGEVGIPAGTITTTTGPHGFGHPVGYVFQDNQTNMEFLRERAARNGFELYVRDGKLNFCAPTSSGSVELKWLLDLFSFRVRVSSSEQVGSVEVRGWNYQTKQAIVSTASSATLLTSNDHGTGVSKATAFSGNPKLIVVDRPISSADEATTMAQSICKEVGGEYIQADARAIGNPDIRAGKVVTLAKMGKYNGSYYVTATRHLYQGGVYSTEFSVRGLRGGDLLATLSPQARLQPRQTHLVGLVTNNVDPKKLGRVKVKFPTLTEAHESDWARVVGVGAGPNRGFDCLPEINDEVLVAFEHGDIHRPYVIGGVWNGTDAPPETVDNSVADGTVRLRTFKTRTGHILQFVEEDKGASTKGIYLTTVGGHKVSMNDTDEGKLIEIKTSGGHQVQLDDQNQNKKVLIQTTGGQKMEMLDTGNKITIQASENIEIKVGGSSITLTATSIELKTGASKITLDAAGVAIEGTMSSLKGTGQAKVEGPLVEVAGQSMTMIKGAILKLN